MIRSFLVIAMLGFLTMGVWAEEDAPRDRLGIVVEIKGSKSSTSLNSLVDEFNSDPNVEQLSGVADILESRVGGNYDIISRSSLRSMLKEQVLQQQSGLVQNEDRMAALAKLKGIKYLLVCSLSGIGSNYSMSLKMLDSTTGQIDRNKRIAITGKSVEELVNRIDYCLESIGMLYQPGTKDTLSSLAVLPFDLNPGVKAVAIENMQISRDSMIVEFANRLTTFMVKSRKFNVVDRFNTDKVINESRMVNSEWAKPGQAKNVGQLLLADYVVTGKINRLEFMKAPQNIDISGESSVQMIGSFKFQLQVIEVKSGKVVSAEDIKVVLSSNDPSANISGLGNWFDFKDALFDRAATSVGNAVLSAIYPIKIAAVNGKDIILNRGEGAGINPGQHYMVMIPNSAVIDPDTGKALGSAETPLAEIIVVQINAKFSVARLCIPVQQQQPINVGLSAEEQAKIQAQAQEQAKTQVVPQAVIQAQLQAQAQAQAQAKAQEQAQTQAQEQAKNQAEYAKNVFAQLRPGAICRPMAPNAPQPQQPDYQPVSQGW